jgi:hypothetical protein
MSFFAKNSFFVNFHAVLELALEGSLDRTAETWLHEKRRTYEGIHGAQGKGLYGHKKLSLTY